MVRQLKSRQQILDLLHQALSRAPQLRSVRAAGVATRARDSAGCNWEVTAWTGDTRMAPGARRELEALVEDLKRRYNAISVVAK